MLYAGLPLEAVMLLIAGETGTILVVVLHMCMLDQVLK